MYFIVKDNAVVGYADSLDSQLPADYRIIQGPTLDPAEAMVENNQIKRKPDLGLEPIGPAVPLADWNGLLNTLRGTPLFNKAMACTNPNAYSTLLFALGTSHNVQDLAFAIAAVRHGLSEDYTEPEIEQFNQMLSEFHIKLTID